MGAKHEVGPGNGVVRDAEPPGEGSAGEGGSVRGGTVGAGAGVGGALVGGVGGGGGAGDVGAGAGAGVDELEVAEAGESGVVEVEALRLGVRGLGTADVGAFVPVEAEPAEVGDGEFGHAGADTGAVEVFGAEDDAAPCPAGKQPGEEEGAGVAEVEAAGGRWSEAAGGL